MSLALPFLLVSAGARLLLTDYFLQIAYQRPGFPSDIYGFSLDERLKYGPYAIEYLFNGEPIDFLAAIRLPGDHCWNPAADAADCALFSDRELRHMADVKRMTTALFSLATTIAVVAVLIVFASRYHAPWQVEIRLGIRRGCQLTLFSLLCLAVLSAAAWDRAFDAFHALFFAAGTWRFPFSDSLIRLYPEQLFVDAAFALAAFTALCVTLILLLLSAAERQSQRGKLDSGPALGRPQRKLRL